MGALANCPPTLPSLARNSVIIESLKLFTIAPLG
jgi:hypothetical protein